MYKHMNFYINDINDTLMEYCAEQLDYTDTVYPQLSEPLCFRWCLNK